MPYTVRKDGPAKTPYCVYKKDTGAKAGCTTKGKLNAYLAALHIHEKSEPESGPVVDLDVEGVLPAIELADELDLASLFEDGEPSVRFCSLFIAKATQDPDGTRRIKAVASDTFEDSFGQRMTPSLFQDFLTRVAEDEPAPPPFVSKAWKGGMPYLGVAHYLDQDGEAIVGTPTSIWVADDRFRFKADMTKTALAEKSWDAIKTDIATNAPDDKRVRVSIAFLDWEHAHVDGTHFVRKSVNEVCPACVKGAKLGEYLKGQLIHFALTRVPVNVRTPIMIERSDMDGIIKTKKDDAAAIVGEDLAEVLEKRERSGVVNESTAAVVVRSDGIGAVPVAVVNPVDVYVGGTVNVQSTEVPKPYGGATTLAGALDYAAAQKMSWKFTDLFWMVRDVIDNSFSDPTVTEKAAAIEGILGEMKGQFSESALMALSRVATPVQAPVESVPVPVSQVSSQTEVSMFNPTHPLAAQLEAIATAYDSVVSKSDLTRTQKFEPIQTALNTLGLTIKSAVDAATPTSTADVEDTVRRVLMEVLPAFMPQSVPAASGSQSPAPRQVTPAAAVTFRATTPTGVKPSQLRTLARRSVGLPVEEGAPNV